MGVGGGKEGLKERGCFLLLKKEGLYERGFIEDLRYDLLVTSSDALPLRQQEMCDS